MFKIQIYIFICSLMGILQLTRGTQALEIIVIRQIFAKIKQVQSQLPDKELIASMNKIFQNCVSNNNPEECNSQLRPDVLQRKLALSRILSNDLANLAKINEYEFESALQTPNVKLSRKRRALLAMLGQILGPLAGLVTESEGAEIVSQIKKLDEKQNTITNMIQQQQTQTKIDLNRFEPKVERQSDQIQDIRDKVTEVTNRLSSLVMYEQLFEQVKNLSEGSQKLEEKLDKFIDATQSVIKTIKNTNSTTT